MLITHSWHVSSPSSFSVFNRFLLFHKWKRLFFVLCALEIVIGQCSDILFSHDMAADLSFDMEQNAGNQFHIKLSLVELEIQCIRKKKNHFFLLHLVLWGTKEPIDNFINVKIVVGAYRRWMSNIELRPTTTKLMFLLSS